MRVLQCVNALCCAQFTGLWYGVAEITADLLCFLSEAGSSLSSSLLSRLKPLIMCLDLCSALALLYSHRLGLLGALPFFSSVSFMIDTCLSLSSKNITDSDPEMCSYVPYIGVNT